LTESDQRLQQLTNAVLAGDPEQTRQKTNAALAKTTPNEVLDAVIEGVNILLDLNELGGADPNRLIGADDAITACLEILEPTLSKSQGKFDFTVTVGPIGLEWGHLLSMSMAALLRSVGLNASTLNKTKTALELLRNSEELRADIVLPLLPKEDVEAQLSSLKNEIDRGGFANRFHVIPVARNLPVSIVSPLNVARNVDEAVSKALEWAIKNSVED
jgi:hypothetical protein